MLDNDSSASGDFTAKRYDISISNTTLSLSINVTTILSWANLELENYIQRGNISKIHDLLNDWQDGRAFLCLAHRFYSLDNIGATFENLLGDAETEIAGGGTGGGDVAADMRKNIAFSVFERELGLAPPTKTDPETPIPMYIAKLRHALQLTATDIDNDTNDPWVKRTQTVLDTIQHSRQQLQLLGFHPSPSSRDDTQKRHDPPMESYTASNHAAIGNDDGTHETLSDMHHLERNETDTINGRSRNTSGWEEDLALMEQLLLDLHRLLDEYYSWADDNMEVDLDAATTQTQLNKRKALIQSVKNAHNSFQEYLEHDQQVLGVFRKRALFTQATAPIRQDLDWVQAEMLKTTTTDTGIKLLEDRVQHAGILLHELIQQHSEGDHQINNDRLPLTTDTDRQLPQHINNTIIIANDTNSSDQHQQQELYGAEVDALVKKYRLVQSWVADVRVWFVEAQRIRHWIGERLDILKNMPIPDGVSSQQLTISADEVDALNTDVETLEKELEQFDKEDMYRLRKHVKDLTVDTTKEKDLSPADTTTIEITFTTLMTLDKLKHLLNRHSYDLQILTLRVFWENEYSKTTDWVGTKMDELGDFIKFQARWQHGPDVENGMVENTRSKSAIIDLLLKFEMDVSTFDQGQFTTTVNLYQEMDDTSKVELPGFLESRQVDIEEKFEALVHRASFARRVVEQYLTMVDFMESSHRLLYICMDDLREKLVQQTDGVYALFSKQHRINTGGDPSDDGTNSDIHSIILDIQPWTQEHADIQEQAVRLITETAGLIPTTETASALDQQENDAGNGRVQLTIKARSSELISFGESLEQQLNQYRQALEWNTKLTNVYTGLQHLQNQIDLGTHAVSRLLQDLTDTFGDQALRISESLIHDKDSNWEQQLQDYRQKLSNYQHDYEAFDDNIQHILDLHAQSSATIPTTASDAVQCLENDGKLVDAALQNMATIMNQWKSTISMMKDRQAWESQYHTVSQWMAMHEQKCQHIRMDATWSPDDDSITQENRYAGMWNIASTLKQNWDEFKGQSLPPLVDTLDKLVGGVSSSSESTWVAQRQRQDSLMAKVDEMDTLHTLVCALLEQRKAITQFLTGAQDIRSQGTRYMNSLEASVLQPHTEEISAVTDNKSITLDVFNNKVADLWKQWESFDNDLCTMVTDGKQDNWGTSADLERHCDSVKNYASARYHELLSLAQSLEQWEDTIKDCKTLHHDIKIWSDKVHSLNVLVMDTTDTLAVKKDKLLTILTLDHIIEGVTRDDLDDDSQLGGTNQLLDDLDRLVQQWQDHEFTLLDADGRDLQHGTEIFMGKLTNLGYDYHGKETMDITAGMNSNESSLNRLKSQCETVVKPLLSLVRQMVETSDKRNIWTLEWIKLSSYSDEQQKLLQGVVLDKKHWLDNMLTEYLTDTLQQISEKMDDISLDKNINDGQQLLDVENDYYNIMEQQYRDLTTHQIPDTLHLPPLILPTELQNQHEEIQQSIPRIHMTLKQLGTDIKWLGLGASWLLKADNQLENWRVVMGDLVNFTERDAKWKVGSNEKGKSHSDTDDSTDGDLDLGTILTNLGERVGCLTGEVDTCLDELQRWKLAQPAQGSNVDDASYLNEFKLWQQKALELENYRSDTNSYMTYAANMVTHRQTLQDWLKKVSGLELQGNSAKAALLAENGNLGTAELDQLVTDFDDELKRLIEDTQDTDYPRSPDLSIQRLDTTATLVNSNISSNDNDDGDGNIRQYIISRHEQLKATSSYLHFVLDTKERSARLKALVDGHVAKVLESLQWIKTTDEKLQEITSGEVSDWDMDLLQSKLRMVHDLENSMDLHADAYYHGLKISADYCRQTMGLEAGRNGQEKHDDGNGDDDDSMLQLELERINGIQQQVDQNWKNLLESLQRHGNNLKNALQQAERTYWAKQLKEKCKVVDDQLNNISHSNICDIEDEQLNQWQHTINEIKSVDLKHLNDLFDSEHLEKLDDDSLLVLDSTTNTHMELENRMHQIYLNVQHERQKSKYSNLVSILIGFTDNTKIKLAELEAEFGQFSVAAKMVDDETHYDSIKVLWDSIQGDWTKHEQMCDQEGGLFLSVTDDADDFGDTTKFDQQHQQLIATWSRLQQEMETTGKYYHVLGQRRSILDTLHRANSILDNIGDNDDNDTKQQIDRIQKLMADASTSMTQQQQTESQTLVTDNEKKMCSVMDDIYQKRRGVLLDRLEIVEKEIHERQQQRYIQQLQQRYQETADKIKSLAENEISTLALLQPEDDASIAPNSETTLHGQQYQEWLEKLGLHKQIFENLTQEAESMVDSMKSSGELESITMDKLIAVYQGPLDKLGNHIQQKQMLLAIVRQVLAHSKSADNISSWLEHFRKALDGLDGDGAPLESNMDSDQTQEEDINDLEVKLHGFEGIMESLRNMNKTIQDYDTLDDLENPVALRWKQLAQDRNDKMNSLWNASVDALELGKIMAIKTQNAILLARKIKSLMSMMGDSRDQIEQLQASLSTNGTLSADDNTHEQQNRPSVFKLIPRNRDLSSAYDKLETIENNMVTDGQSQRMEISQLIEQLGDDDSTTPFLHQQDELNAAWNNIMDTINKTKRSLCDEKGIGQYLGVLDDIDVLLDSMEDVVLKASPHHHSTTTDSDLSKAELQAKIIELNARHDYYKLNIEQHMQHANDYWTSTMTDNSDTNQDFIRLKAIVMQHHTAQKARWSKLSNQQIPACQLQLKKAMASSLGETEEMTRIRKSSLPTRKAAATLTPQSLHPTTSSRLRPPKTISTGLHPSSALTGQQRLRTVSSSSSLTSHDKNQHRPRQSTSTTTSTSSLSTKSTKSASSLSTKSTRSTSSTFPGGKRKTTTAPVARKPPNSYVAQKGNALDVEIGRIVNEAPYKVKVKMVPGEVGRYWFGDVNPKLVYCRVLKSKMVMVRVGGGWAELSQFLRDHAKLEGELFIPKQEDQHLLHTTMKEGYLETTSSLQRQRKQRMQKKKGQTTQHDAAATTTLTVPTPVASISSSSSSSSIPIRSISKTSSSNNSSTIQQNGYKDGDKFIAVDRHGKQLEVKMTRFSQRSALPTSTTRKGAKP